MKAASPAGELLRQWRQRRRMSQLDLAIAAGISARHLSFVETGRSRPTSGMILRLSEHLDVPLRERNALLLQITADVTGRPIAAARVPDASAVGAAIYAVAAAEEASDMTDVVRRMGSAERVVYRPDGAARRVYDGLYADYLELARHFGEGASGIMRRLHAMHRSGRA